MKRVLCILPATLLLLCLPSYSRAQDQSQTQAQSQTQTQPAPASKGTDPGIPEWELAGGYTFLRANVNGTGSSFNMNGGFGSITENMNRWFGGRFEFNAWGGTLNGTNVTAQTYTYGPVFSYHKFSRSTFFAEAQFGAIHASEGYLGISQSANKFAMMGEGGIDFKMGKRAAIRVQGGYLMTRFLAARQDNLQVSTGLVIYLGSRNK